MIKPWPLRSGLFMVKIYVHAPFCNTDLDDMVGLHESIRRLHRLLARATMSSAPVEPYKLELQSVCHS